MLPDYTDIRALTDAEPLWFDGAGVPRYAPFHPDLLGVYDEFAVCARIACQGCRNRLVVGRGWVRAWLSPTGSEVIRPTLGSLVEGFRYGDPPYHGCVGDSMSSVGLEVIEAWERVSAFEWVHRAEFDGRSILPEWVEEESFDA